MQRLIASGLLIVTVSVLVAWFVITRDCAGQAPLTWYFIVTATAALTGSTYVFVSTKTGYRSIPIVSAAVVAVVGGFGIFLFVVFTSLAGCLN
jgi:hypothetical protein